MGRGGFMMWWRMGRRSLGALALLFGLIAGYYPQPAEAQVTFTQITNTTGTGDWGYFAINADGTRIAFSSVRDLTGGNPDGNGEIFLWTQGVGFTQITNTVFGFNTNRSISADGTRIAFQSENDLTGGNPDGNREIFLATLSTVPPNPPVLSVSSSSLDFGTIAVGASKDLTFTVTNTGGETLTGTASASAPYSILPTASFSLSAGQSQDITVRFSPTAGGTFVSNVSVTSNGGSASPGVQGTGFLPPPPVLSFDNPTTVPKNKLCDYGSKTCGAPGKYHTGIDYSGDGTAVAVAYGTVVRIEKMSPSDKGMGNNVIVSHILPDGSTIFSTYSHLASIDSGITENWPVDKGQTIGVIGCTGFNDQYSWCRNAKKKIVYSPHLHFEMKIAAVTGNPKGVGKQNSICKGGNPNNAGVNTCWGYVGNRLVPDQYGYVDPNRYLP